MCISNFYHYVIHILSHLAGGNRDIPRAIRYSINHFSQYRRDGVPKEFIFITSKTDVANSGVLERLFTSFSQNNIQLKFGILGKPTTRFVDFLTKGRSPDQLVSIENDSEPIFKFFKLLKPAVSVIGMYACTFDYWNNYYTYSLL